MYSFPEKMKQGAMGEAKLDEYFKARGIRISKVSPTAQKMGIDRVFELQNGIVLSVEYKTDIKAATTGNVFVETESIAEGKKPGWAYASYAQLLIYYIPPKDIAYMAWMAWVKINIEKWKKEYREMTIESGGIYEKYHTKGVIIRTDTFVTDCRAITLNVEKVEKSHEKSIFDLSG